MNVALPTIATLMLAMYFLAGLNKLRSFPGTVAGLRKRLPAATPALIGQAAVALVVALEIAAPPVIVHSAYTGQRRRLASDLALGLAGFTVLATLLYHFPPKGAEYYAFMKNLTATGGLLLLAAVLR